jgi:uncharacterized protein (TIGR02217 family)
MSFLETPRFPDNLQYNTVGGPVFSVDIATVQSGRGFRKANRDIALHRYNINQVKTQTDFETILDYFYALGGPEHGFRLKDPGDYKSLRVASTPAYDDVVIGVGDSIEIEYQLVKLYQPAGSALSHERIINKPVSGSVLAGFGGVQKTQGVDWTLATGTGLITFATGSIPATGQDVTSGFMFDVPVSIDSQSFETTFSNCNIMAFNLPLVEIIPE